MTMPHDDAFREIQLSGKQLVFLFMAGTVVAVVIFLSGVMVGRGVRAERGAPTGAPEASALASATVETGPPPPPPASASPATSGQPLAAGEKLSYPARLNGAAPAAEQLQKAEPPPPAEEDAKVEKAGTAPAPVAEPASGEPAGSGFAIQVAALRDRTEADAVVKRLAGKGYPAYVLAPVKGAPTVYRVRVGKFKDRREADSIAARLQTEEQFKPWVVR